MTKPKEPAKALMLRTCDTNLQSHGGFQWPRKGKVAAPDWNPKPVCGGGLHGLLWGKGDGSLLNWSDDAVWLVVEVSSWVEIAGGRQVKAPAGEVIYAGDRHGATALIQKKGGTKAIGCAGGMATAGIGGTATAGDGGTATAGDRGTATAGYGGTATAGYRGTATAGDGGCICIRYWNGEKCCMAASPVGENGVEANKPYRYDAEKMQFVEVRK